MRAPVLSPRRLAWSAIRRAFLRADDGVKFWGALTEWCDAWQPMADPTKDQFMRHLVEEGGALRWRQRRRRRWLERRLCRLLADAESIREVLWPRMGEDE